MYGVKVVAVVPRVGALVGIPRPKKWRESLIRNVFHLGVGDVVDVRVRDMRAARERRAVLTLLEMAEHQPERRIGTHEDGYVHQ